MKGKFLTRNIILFTECSNESCNNTDTLDIQALRDYGEGDCPECDHIMIISQECIIKD